MRHSLSLEREEDAGAAAEEEEEEDDEEVMRFSRLHASRAGSRAGPLLCRLVCLRRTRAFECKRA